MRQRVRSHHRTLHWSTLYLTSRARPPKSHSRVYGAVEASTSTSVYSKYKARTSSHALMLVLSAFQFLSPNTAEYKPHPSVYNNRTDSVLLYPASFVSPSGHVASAPASHDTSLDLSGVVNPHSSGKFIQAPVTPQQPDYTLDKPKVTCRSRTTRQFLQKSGKGTQPLSTLNAVLQKHTKQLFSSHSLSNKRYSPSTTLQATGSLPLFICGTPSRLPQSKAESRPKTSIKRPLFTTTTTRAAGYRVQHLHNNIPRNKNHTKTTAKTTTPVNVQAVTSRPHKEQSYSQKRFPNSTKTVLGELPDLLNIFRPSSSIRPRRLPT